MGKSGPASREEATLAASDIARLAGVGKAAVSNWRRRHADFPQPAGGSAASPLYRLVDVEQWLSQHGRSLEMQPADRVWQQIRGTVEDLRLGELVSLLGSALVLRERKPRRWKALAALSNVDFATQLGPAVTELVADLPGPPPREVDQAWIPILRAGADAAREQGAPQAMDLFFTRYAEIHARRMSVTAQPLARLMVDLAGATCGMVLDPACGSGELMLAAYASGADRLLGQEAEPAAARLAAIRLALAGADARVALGNSLTGEAHASDHADAVLCNPPWGTRSWGYDELINDPRWEYGLPPRGEPELAWVQHCLARLRPGGYAVVTMPIAAAHRRPGRRIRSNLLRSGALRAVITVPSAVTTSPTDLWLVQRPVPGNAAPAHLVLGDFLDAASIPEVASSLSGDPAGWTGPHTRAISVIDLLDDEVDLRPRSHVAGQALTVTATGYGDLHAALSNELQRLAAALPALEPADGSPNSAMTTLGELVKAGTVTVYPGPLRIEAEGGPDPVLTVRDVHRGLPASGATTESPGMIWVQQGDVVLAAGAREPTVRVIAQGGALLGMQLMLLRPDPDRTDPHFLAGCIHVTQRHAMAHNISTSSRTDIYRTAVPRLPLDRQRAFGQVFRQLMEFEDGLRNLTSRANELIRLGFGGLTGGSLAPPD